MPPEILDLLPGIKLFPGEDEITYQGLRQAFLADLAPGSPYETALAENLVRIEWEAIRHRNIRDNLIITNYRQLAKDIFTGENRIFSLHDNQYSEEVEKMAADLVDPDEDIRSAPEAELAANFVVPSELLAEAYASIAGSLEHHQRILADFEIRRRRLRLDYDNLKAARIRPVEDAEIVEQA